MTEEKEKHESRYSRWMVIIAVQFAAVGIFAINGATASIISDIPNELNDALLDGSSLYAAKMILTAAIMVSVGLFLSISKMPVVGIFIVLLCTLGALTAIGWADISILILTAFIIVFMFGKTIFPIITGGSGG